MVNGKPNMAYIRIRHGLWENPWEQNQEIMEIHGENPWGKSWIRHGKNIPCHVSVSSPVQAFSAPQPLPAPQRAAQHPALRQPTLRVTKTEFPRRGERDTRRPRWGGVDLLTVPDVK